MSGTSSNKNTGQNQVDLMLSEIMEALEIIKKSQPNGELRVIQERIEKISAGQEDMKEDLRAIKRQMLDPEDGLIVRVNKNTEFRKIHEEEYKEFHKDFLAIKEDHKDLLNFKATAVKVIWILFTAVAGVIITLLLSQLGN